MPNYLKDKNISAWLIFGFMLWLFIFFFLLQKDMPALESSSLSFLHSLAIVLILFYVQNFLIPKLSVFSPTVQIVLKATLYGLGFFAGYIFVFIIRLIVTISPDYLISQLYDYLYEGIVRLFSGSILCLQVENLVAPEIQSAFFTMLLLLLLIVILSVLGGYIETRWRQVRTEQKLKEAQINILQAQMEPHFLFNTLNTIVSTVRKDPRRAENLIIHLSDFFRYTFSASKNQNIRLGDELTFLENYLILLQARYGENLKWEISTDPECSDIKIPSMILQPLVENSIKHGWKDEGNPLKIQIKCFQDKDHFVLKLTDNGKGIGVSKKLNFPPEGHALDNIRQRLLLSFNDSDLLKISSNLNDGTTVEIYIPRSKE